MLINYTENEIFGNKLAPGNYDFIINDVAPIYTTDFSGNEIVRLNFKLECIAGDIDALGIEINYPVTIQSATTMHQNVGRNILRTFVMAIYPGEWQQKLKNLETEELVGQRFNADISYKNDKYLQFHKVKKTTLASLTPLDKSDESNLKINVPF